MSLGIFVPSYGGERLWCASRLLDVGSSLSSLLLYPSSYS